MCVRINTSVFPAVAAADHQRRGALNIILGGVRRGSCHSVGGSNLPYYPCGIRIFTATLVEEVRESFIPLLASSTRHLSPFFQFRKLTGLPLWGHFCLLGLLPAATLLPERSFPVFVPIFGLFKKKFL